MIGTYLNQVKFFHWSWEREQSRGEVAGWTTECPKVISLSSANIRWFQRVCLKHATAQWPFQALPCSHPPMAFPHPYSSPVTSPSYWWKIKVKRPELFPPTLGTWTYFSFCLLFYSTSFLRLLPASGPLASLILAFPGPYSLSYQLFLHSSFSALPSDRHTFLFSGKRLLLSP